MPFSTSQPIHSLSNPFALWLNWVSSFSPESHHPEDDFHEYSQPILPGWTFANTVVNEHNSKDPAMEKKIVGELSYGQQLGKIIKAVSAIANATPALADDASIKELLKLGDKIEKIKKHEADSRFEHVLEDLKALQQSNLTKFNERMAALGALGPLGVIASQASRSADNRDTNNSQ